MAPDFISHNSSLLLVVMLFIVFTFNNYYWNDSAKINVSIFHPFEAGIDDPNSSF